MIKHSLASIAALTAAAWAFSVPATDWKIAGPFGGTALTVTIDPQNANVLLAGAMNSLLFESQDSGATWNVLNFPKRNLSEVTAILVDPADSKHYLAGTVAGADGGLFESADEGKTWRAAKEFGEVGVRALAFAGSSPSRFVAGTLRGVMLSDDSGKTWKRISDPQNLEMQGITAVAIDPKNADIIYAGTAHLPWKTADGGKTWVPIHTGMIDDSDVFSIYVDPSVPNNVLASACSGIYASTDRGELWHKLLGIPNTSRRTHVVREDPSNAKTIYAGTTMGLFKSTNHGITWKTLNNTQVNSMTFDPLRPDVIYLALEYEGVGKSDNGGEQINLVNKGFVDRVISSIAVSGSKLLALETQENETTGIFVSSDQGESWVQLRRTRGLAGVHLRTITGSFSEDRILLAATSHQMYKSIDSGAIWRPLAVRLIENARAEPEKPVQRTKSRAAGAGQARTARVPVPRETVLSEISGLYTIKSGTKDVIFAATDIGLLKSTDLGERWSLVDLKGSTGVTALYFAPNFDGYLIARAAGALYRSVDFGDHWTEMAFPLPTEDINDVAIPVDRNAALLVATRLGLYVSPDDGLKWYKDPRGLPASTVSSVIYTGSEQQAYAVEYGQLYETGDGGNSWSVISTAIPSLRIRQLWMARNSSNRLYGITADLGILFRN